MQTNFEYHSRLPQYETLEENVEAAVRILRQLMSEAEDLTDIEPGDNETKEIHFMAAEELHQAVWTAANKLEGRLR
ncbi:hypothetical protein LF1_08110 [Rubripirellula obstinata]|uniref:Uncharacterized protein n=1 Tax=Rubripirellula obstinata TaxID=406547 RepID=A0A5B1CEK2_9BACT|nr:hypothetical protein [Rubripirellula obstinata]KAA1258295.1 hypothetical protein LF1_08110 [Rubripirellula obstinata]